jgi:hypothetical protein
MRIESLVGLWNPLNCVFLTLLTIPIVVFGDAFAARFIAPRLPSHYNHNLDDNSIVSLLPEESALNLFPNFWVWYEGEAIRKVLRTQSDSHLEYLLLTIYNAAISTNVVFVTLLVITMTLAIYSFENDGRKSIFFKRFLSPFLCVFSFLMDLGEDLFLIVIIVGYPHTIYPQLEILCSWFSFLKFVSWGVILVWWGMMGVKVLIFGKGGEGKQE